MTAVPAALAGRIDVSRETMQRLETYVALVEKWQPRINLVSPNSLPDIWMRHVWDSAQLAPFIPAGTARLLDVGSGGGFPGLVLAMCCNAECHLVESDQRKAVFLSTVIRECGLTAKVHNSRIEALPDLGASVITARALAPLDRLLALLGRQLTPGTRCLFLKGARAEAEIAAAGEMVNLRQELHPSLTNPDGFVIDLTVT